MSVRSHTLTPSLEQGQLLGRTDVKLRPPLHGGFSLETIRLVWLDPATLEGVCGGSDHLRTTASTIQSSRIQPNLSIGLKTKSRHRVWGGLSYKDGTRPDMSVGHVVCWGPVRLDVLSFHCVSSRVEVTGRLNHLLRAALQCSRDRLRFRSK